MEQEDRLILICLRADAPETVAGASFSFFCQQCGQRVMVSPSGLDLLKNKPAMVIMCYEPCWANRRKEEDDIYHHADSGKLLEDLRRVIPNPWRKRN